MSSLHRPVRGGQLVTIFNGKRLLLFGPSEAVVGGDCSTKKPPPRPLLCRGECGMWPAVEEKNSVGFSTEGHTKVGELPSTESYET